MLKKNFKIFIISILFQVLCNAAQEDRQIKVDIIPSKNKDGHFQRIIIARYKKYYYKKTIELHFENNDFHVHAKLSKSNCKGHLYEKLSQLAAAAEYGFLALYMNKECGKDKLQSYFELSLKCDVENDEKLEPTCCTIS